MSTKRNDEIRTAPVDLYDRLRGVSERLSQLRREFSEIRHEYETLRSHPGELAVDSLGDPIDPAVATDMVIHDLGRVDSELTSAAYRLSDTRGRYATRLKLTDQAAEELDRRRTGRSIERTR